MLLSQAPQTPQSPKQRFCLGATEEPKTCLVLCDDGEDNENPTAFMTQEDTPSTEPARQTHLSTRAFAIPASDLTMEDDDERWSTGADHGSGWVVVWNTVLFVRGFLEQMVSFVMSKKVPRHVFEFLGWSTILPYWCIDFDRGAKTSRIALAWSLYRWMQRLFSQRFDGSFYSNDF